MLNEASNNNDAMRIANIMLNEVPNSNNNKKCMFNYHGHTTMLNGGYIAIIQKSQLTRDER